MTWQMGERQKTGLEGDKVGHFFESTCGSYDWPLSCCSVWVTSGAWTFVLGPASAVSSVRSRVSQFRPSICRSIEQNTTVQTSEVRINTKRVSQLWRKCNVHELDTVSCSRWRTEKILRYICNARYSLTIRKLNRQKGKLRWYFSHSLIRIKNKGRSRDKDYIVV
jgi:hypothetical protein